MMQTVEGEETDSIHHTFVDRLTEDVEEELLLPNLDVPELIQKVENDELGDDYLTVGGTLELSELVELNRSGISSAIDWDRLRDHGIYGVRMIQEVDRAGGVNRTANEVTRSTADKERFALLSKNFDFHPKIVYSSGGDFKLPDPVIERFREPNAYMYYSPSQNNLGLWYPNGRELRNFHGKGTTTCLQSDNMNMDRVEIDSISSESVIEQIQRLHETFENRCHIINLTSPANHAMVDQNGEDMEPDTEKLERMVDHRELQPSDMRW